MKKRKKSNLSIIGVITTFILFYLIVIIVGHVTKRNVETYTVQFSNFNTDFHADALITRSEKIVTAKEDGYIIFYSNNLGKVLKGDVLYINDSNGNFYNELISKNSNNSKSISNSVQREISENINSFISNREYNSLIKTNSIAQYIQDAYLNDISTDDIVKIIENYNKTNNSLTINRSDNTGIFVNSVDGYEELSTERVMENISNYRKLNTNTILTNTFVKKGTPIGKIIDSENWNIVFELNKNEYESFKDDKYLRITFDSDNTDILGVLELNEQNGKYFANVSFDQGMIRYAQLRNVKISVKKRQLQGYLVPKTSVKEIEGKNGVFVTNSGIAVFTPINIIGEQENNYIIDTNTKLKSFDNIAIKAKRINDQEKIYR